MRGRVLSCILAASLPAVARAAGTPVGLEGTVAAFLPAGVHALTATAHSPVRLRVDDVQVTPAAGTYALHYQLLAAGTYDLRAYLCHADETPLTEGAPVLVTGVSELATGDRGVLQVVPPAAMPHYGGYAVLRWIVATVWLAGLVAIVWPRRKRAVVRPVVEAVPEPVSADRFSDLIAAAATRAITPREQLDLELFLLAHWRGRLGLSGPADRAMRAVRADARAGPAFAAVDQWLHAPPDRAVPVDVTAVFGPCAGAAS